MIKPMRDFFVNQMRLDALNVATIIARKGRAFRDLIRLRVELVMDCGRYRTTYQNFFNNQRYLKMSNNQLNRLVQGCFAKHPEILKQYFDDANIAMKDEYYLRAMYLLSSQIGALDDQIKNKNSTTLVTVIAIYHI